MCLNGRRAGCHDETPAMSQAYSTGTLTNKSSISAIADVYVNLNVVYDVKRIHHHHHHHHHQTSGKAIWCCISSSICQERLHVTPLLAELTPIFSKAFNEVICTHESNIMVFCHSDAFLHAWPVERSNKFRENHVEAHRPANVMSKRSKRSILFNGNPWSGLVLSANGIPIFIMVFLLLRDMRTSATWLDISTVERSCYCIPRKPGASA